MKVLKLEQNLQPPAQALILKSFPFDKSEPESRIFFFFLWLGFFYFWDKNKCHLVLTADNESY